jgi:hypothetical protein
MLFDRLVKFSMCEEQTILMLIQIVEANGTLEPMLDSRKSDGADRVIVVAASRWLGLVVFLVVLILAHLLLVCLLLGHLLPQERDNLAIKDSLCLKFT